ncbi:LOW QUALITY PROTEIN: ATP/GTP-binding protein [Coccidioides immitis RMSCC 2394]|uniref:Polynucleotide 5'-hydroxyl-kinase GRC3 n=1 Tax=Coccidioides immitis RMSCC 2394 TaxID=404692 RepID=A0A0J6YJA3_COCIT|nr:LOW QUALITY PROTEIN: ATP/GTP-binding protein [Coccidioides immitis RMSCC 2394]
MAEYANVHFALETMRHDAKAAGRDGPRVLILGPEDAGKTSLAKILTGYATKMGRQPLVVNLDPSEGMLSVPGALTATAFRSMIDVEEGWGSSPMSGPSPIPVKLPLVYFYGLPACLDGDGSYYKAIVGTGCDGQDGRGIRMRGKLVSLLTRPASFGQGKGASEDVIHHIVTEFSISTILVIGSERLYSTMVKNYDNKPIATSATAAASDERISVVKLTKSGGCVDRDATFMKYVRESQIRSYFFGSPVPSTASSALSLSSTTTGTTMTLSPHTSQVDFNSLSIYSITIATEGEEDEYDPSKFDSFLPGGHEENDHNTSLTGTTSLQPPSGLLPGLRSELPSATTGFPSASTSSTTPFTNLPSPAPMSLANTLLAITNAAPNASLDEVRDASIMGFIYIADVDEKKGQGGKLRLLAPVGGRVPNRAMIWGRKWPGEVVGLIG